MNATQKAALLAVYQTDTTLQVLLGGVSNATKCSYSLIPPEFPSVNLWEESDNGDPRAGYDQNGVCDHDVTVAIHIYAFDEGKKIGGSLLRCEFSDVRHYRPGPDPVAESR